MLVCWYVHVYNSLLYSCLFDTITIATKVCNSSCINKRHQPRSVHVNRDGDHCSSSVTTPLAYQCTLCLEREGRRKKREGGGRRGREGGEREGGRREREGEEGEEGGREGGERGREEREGGGREGGREGGRGWSEGGEGGKEEGESIPLTSLISPLGLKIDAQEYKGEMHQLDTVVVKVRL